MLLRSALILLLASCQSTLINGGLSEPAVAIDIGMAPPDIRAPSDPGMPSGTVMVPAFQQQDLLFVQCNDFFAQNPVSFNIGVNPVTCLAQGSSELSLTFNVIVFDCEAPVFTHCDLIGNEAVAPPGETSAPVWYTPPPATDNDGVTPNVVCDPQPGALFPIGTTPVTCLATDQSGNSIGIATHQVTVTAAPPLEPIDPSPVLPCGPHELKNANDGSCQACPAGQVPNADDTGCAFCEKGQVRGNQEGTAASGCVFAHGICDIWEKGVNGECKDCPAGKIGKPDERGCMYCPPGFVRGNSAGDLLSGCVEAKFVCDAEIGSLGKCIGCAYNQWPNGDYTECLDEMPMMVATTALPDPVTTPFP